MTQFVDRADNRWLRRPRRLALGRMAERSWCKGLAVRAIVPNRQTTALRIPPRAAERLSRRAVVRIPSPTGQLLRSEDPNTGPDMLRSNFGGSLTPTARRIVAQVGRIAVFLRQAEYL